MLDVEKRLAILSDPIPLDVNNKMNSKPTENYLINSIIGTWWIDVSPSNGNLVVSGGYDGSVKIFDRREAAVVATFDDVHSGEYLD